MALDLLKARTGASVVGFLWPSDEGELRARVSLPADEADRLELSPSLNEMVARAGNAVWVANQQAPSSDPEGTVQLGVFRRRDLRAAGAEGVGCREANAGGAARIPGGRPLPSIGL